MRTIIEEALAGEAKLADESLDGIKLLLENGVPPTSMPQTMPASHPTKKKRIGERNPVSDLAQHLPDIDGLATIERFADFVKRAVVTLAGGNRAKFCELMGLPRWAVTGWLSHGEKPTLPQFISICYGINLMPSELFLGEPEQVLSSIKNSIRPVPKKLFDREARPLLSVKERQRLATSLAEIANDTENVRPLSAVAKPLGLTRSCLKYWFPEECAVILNKHNATKKLFADTRKQSEQKVVMGIVQAVRERGEYPSRRKINVALRSYKLSLARQDLLRVYRQVMEVVKA